MRSTVTAHCRYSGSKGLGKTPAGRYQLDQITKRVPTISSSCTARHRIRLIDFRSAEFDAPGQHCLNVANRETQMPNPGFVRIAFSSCGLENRDVLEEFEIGILPFQHAESRGRPIQTDNLIEAGVLGVPGTLAIYLEVEQLSIETNGCIDIRHHDPSVVKPDYCVIRLVQL